MGDRKTNREINEYTDALASLCTFKITSEVEDPLTEVKLRARQMHELCNEFDMKPTVDGLALAIGITKNTLSNWKAGRVQWVNDAGITEFLELEWTRIQTATMTAMAEGTIDKISGIFIARNNFEYQNEDVKIINVNISENASREELIEQSKQLQLIEK